MRIIIDPLAKLRSAAELRIEVHFNNLARGNVQKDQEHALKRQEAVQHVGGNPSELLKAEAGLSGVSADDLARTILSKPNDLAERALARRKAILRVRSAKTIDDLDAVLTQHGINKLAEEHGADLAP